MLRCQLRLPLAIQFFLFDCLQTLLQIHFTLVGLPHLDLVPLRSPHPLETFLLRSPHPLATLLLGLVLLRSLHLLSLSQIQDRSLHPHYADLHPLLQLFRALNRHCLQVHQILAIDVRKQHFS